MIEAIRLGDLSQRLGATLHGNPDLLITGVAPLDSAQPGHLSFLANPKYRDQLRSTQAGAVIVPAAGDAAERSWLVAENPYLVFTEAVKLFAPPIPVPPPGVHPMAWVDPAARVGAAAAIGPFCVVGANAEIGDRTVLSAQVFVGEGTVIGADSVLYPGTVVRERVRIGNRVILHPGVVIGGDGFGFAPADGVYHKIPQIGTVVIEDDVEIGANTTVDRAALGETRIGRGAKLDNLIMVAHNVVIGAHTVIAAQVGISGSTQVGDHVMIGGQAGFGGHLRVGDQAVIGAQAGVTQSVDAKTFVSGYPARPHAQATRQLAAVARLPELQKKVRDLEARLANLEKP